jgi:TetR/AcrR family transcriptional repressor of mexJK operon
MFYEQGFEETTMDAVAHRAAISKGTLYARFPNKADLFRAVIETQVERWSDAATRSAPTPPGTPLDTALRLYGMSILAAAGGPEARALERLVAGAAERFPELAAQFDAVGFGRGVALVSALLRRESADGAGPADPGQAAKIFIAMIMGWPRNGVDADDLAGRALYVEQAVAIFMQGRSRW